MAIEPRILRNNIEPRDTARPPPTTREIQRRERIIAMGTIAMAAHGTEQITTANLAIALGMAPITLRRHFPDMHALLGEILTRHLLALAAAIGEIPQDTPNRPYRQRQAYLEFTRIAFGGHTEAHTLLVRDLRLLPDDIRAPLEQTRDLIGQSLAGPAGREALILLDTPYLAAERIEMMLAPILPKNRPAPPQPRLTKPEPEPIQTPTLPDPVLEKPGAWIFTSGIPTAARSPPP